MVADIVAPHGPYFADALPKLKGLAQYAETHGNCYRRIESVAEFKSKLRLLNLKREEVRKAAAPPLKRVSNGARTRRDMSSRYV